MAQARTEIARFTQFFSSLLKLPTDVERVLRPLLPLRPERASLVQQSALDLLPRLLAAQQIPEEVTRVVVDAFRQQSSLLEQLHQQRGEE